MKMYDKQGSVLRIETTIVQPRDFKVFRGTEADPENLQWRKLRKGVVDLRRRAEVSQASNDRYAAAMAAADCTKPLKDLAEPVCRRTRQEDRPIRALNPLGKEDAALLTIVNDALFTPNGFRNRDVRAKLYASPTTDPREQKRRSGSGPRNH
ncbi:MAG: hypothetical protein ABSH20_17325 [Tepidisphaeraceae bacterium]